MKKIVCALACLVFFVITLFGLCSCNQSFKYDWTKVDAYMKENGVDYPAVKNINGSTFLDKGTAIVITYDNDEDKRTTVQLIRLDNYTRQECYLEFKIEYLTQIPDTVFYVDIFWHLPYNKTDKFDVSYCRGEIASYNPKEINSEIINNGNYDAHELYELHVKHVKRVAVLLSDLKIDQDGQFVSCKYDYQKISHTLSIGNGYLEQPVLDKDYEKYLNEVLTVGIANTTDFFNKNQLPLLYEFADIMTHWEIYERDKLI